MKRFLEMIEQVKRQKTIAAPSIELSADRMSMVTGPTKHYPTEMFFHFAEHCVPFVFEPIGKEPTDIPEGEYDVALDAPFKIFSVEILGGHITVPDVKKGVVDMFEKGDTSWLKEQLYIDCIMVVEHKPKEFMCFCLFNMNGEINVTISPGIDSIVHQLLKRLKREATGVENVRERIKIGSGKDKRVATLRKIVHVKPKKLLLEGVASGARSIDWSHRWAVRGHWRVMQGLGKDRDGNYSVENMTWVSEYEKGPDDAPLVKKTRYVDES